MAENFRVKVTIKQVFSNNMELVMKKIIGVVFVIAIVGVIFLVADNNIRIPNGWFPAGSNPSEYEMGD